MNNFSGEIWFSDKTILFFIENHVLQFYTDIGYAADCEKNENGKFKKKGIPFKPSNL